MPGQLRTCAFILLAWSAGCLAPPAEPEPGEVRRGPLTEFALVGISGVLTGEGEGEPQFCSGGPFGAEAVLALDERRIDMRNIRSAGGIGNASILEWTAVALDAPMVPRCMELPSIVLHSGKNATVSYAGADWQVTVDRDGVLVDGLRLQDGESVRQNVSLYIPRFGRAGPWNLSGELQLTNYGIWPWSGVQEVPGNGVIAGGEHWAKWASWPGLST